ncbi:MAG: CsbD family protein [Chloroflexota bacterium]
MNTDYGFWDQLAGQWKQLRGNVREAWGKLTDDDLEQAKGSRDKLVGRIQERYGITKEEANSQVDRWAENFREKMR